MANKNIIISLQVKEDSKAKLIIKNLSEKINSINTSFKKFGTTAASTESKMTKLSGVLNDVRKRMQLLEGRVLSANRSFTTFKKNLTSLRSVVFMLRDSLRKVRKEIDSVFSSAAKKASIISNVEKTTTKVLASEVNKRESLRKKEKVSTISTMAGSKIEDKAISERLNFLEKLKLKLEEAVISKNKLLLANINYLKELDLTNRKMKEKNKIYEDTISKMGFVVMKVVRLMIAYQALRLSISLVQNEIKNAFFVIEEYQQSIVEMASLMTTFGDIKDENISDFYTKSYEYAKKLVIELEKLDAVSIAGAEDFRAMARAFLMNGVQIDVSNKKVLEGVKRIADALKILVGYIPNQQWQITQEINALLRGENRPGDVLARLMKQKLGSGWKEILEEWKKSGADVFLIKIGEQLEGFGKATENIKDLWSTLASTFKTIHDKIFRDAFVDFNVTIKNMLKNIIESLRDEEGNLTPLGRDIGKVLVNIWGTIKNLVRDIYFILQPILFITKEILKVLYKWREVIISFGTVLTALIIAKLSGLLIFGRTIWKSLTQSADIMKVLTGLTKRFYDVLLLLAKHPVISFLLTFGSGLIMLKNRLDNAKKSVDELRQSFKFLTLEELSIEEKKLESKLKYGKYHTIQQKEDLSITSLDVSNTRKIQEQIKNTSKELIDLKLKIQNIDKGKDKQVIESLKNEQKRLEKQIEYLNVSEKILKNEQERKFLYDQIKKGKGTSEDLEKIEELEKAGKALKEYRDSLKILLEVGGKTKEKFGGLLTDIINKMGSTLEEGDINKLKALQEEKRKKLKEIAKEFYPITPVPLKAPVEEKEGMTEKISDINKEISLLKEFYRIKVQELKESKEKELNIIESNENKKLISEIQAANDRINYAYYYAYKEIEIEEEKNRKIQELYDKLYKTTLADTSKNKQVKAKNIIEERKNEALEHAQTIKKIEEETWEYVNKIEEKVFEEEKSRALQRAQFAYDSREKEASSILNLIKIEEDRKKAELDFQQEKGKISLSAWYKGQEESLLSLKENELHYLDVIEEAWKRLYDVKKEQAGKNLADILKLELENTDKMREISYKRKEIEAKYLADVEELQRKRISMEEESIEIRAARKYWEDVKQQFDANFDIITSKTQNLLNELNRLWELGLINEEDLKNKRIKIYEEEFQEKNKILFSKSVALTDAWTRLYKALQKEDKKGKLEEIENIGRDLTREIQEINAVREKLKSELKEKVGEEEVKYKLLIRQLTLQEISLNEQLQENKNQFLLEYFKTEEDMHNKKLEWLRQEEEIGAEEFYKTRLISIMNVFNKEKEALEKSIEIWKQAFDKRKELATERKEDLQALESERISKELEFSQKSIQIEQERINKIRELLREAFSDIEFIGDVKGITGVLTKAVNDVEKEWKKKWGKLFDFTKDIYKNLAESFSDILYDSITMDLKKLENYFEKFWQSILRYMTDEAGKEIAKFLKDLFVNEINKTINFLSTEQISYQNRNLLNLANSYKFQIGSGKKIYDENKQMLTNSSVTDLQNSLIVTKNSLDSLTKETAENTIEISNNSSGLSKLSAGMTAFAAVMNVIAQFKAGNTGAGIGGSLGLVAGAIIGSIGGIPGAFLGAGLGGAIGSMIGSLFDDEEEEIGEMFLEFKDNVVSIATKNLGLKDNDKRKFQETFSKYRDNLIQAFSALNINVDNFYRSWKATVETKENAGKAFAKIMRQYIMDTLGFDIKKFKTSDETLEQLLQRIVSAIQGMAKLNVELDEYVKSLGSLSDEMIEWHVSMRLLNYDIETYKNALEKATDPSDFYEMAKSLKEAYIDKYNKEKELVLDLKDKLENARKEAKDFSKEIIEKIFELLPEEAEKIGRYKSKIGFESPTEQIIYINTILSNAYKNINDLLNNADAKTEDIIEGWKEFKSAVDEWYSTHLEAINNQYEVLKDAINEEIDALKKKQDVIKNELDILNKQKDIIDNWKDLLDDIRDTIREMNFSMSNQRDIFERLEYIKEEVIRAKGRYEGAVSDEEKIKYAKEFKEVLEDYLQLAQDAFQRPSKQYQNIYEEVMMYLQDIESLASIKSQGIEDLLDRIAFLENESTLIDKSIEEKEAKLVELEKQQQEDIEELKRDAKEYYLWIKENALQVFNDRITDLEKQLKDIIGDKSVGDYITGLQEQLKKDLQDIKNLMETFVQDLTPTATVEKEDINKILALAKNPFRTAGKKEEDLKNLIKWWKEHKGQTLTSEELETAMKMFQSLAKNPFKNTGEFKTWYEWWEKLPKFDTGGFVAYDMVAKLHKGERVLNPIETKAFYSGERIKFTPIITNNISINTTGNVDANLLAGVIEDKIINSFKNGKGRKILKEAVVYR